MRIWRGDGQLLVLGQNPSRPQQHLPNVRFSDATALVNWQRAVAAAEIGYMRNAARIVETNASAHLPTRSRSACAITIWSPNLRAKLAAWTVPIRRIGGDYPAIVPLLPSGRTRRHHLTWDDKPMKAGEAPSSRLPAAICRYHCPLSRTVFLGRPTQAFLDAERRRRWEGMEQELAARPAMPTRISPTPSSPF